MQLNKSRLKKKLKLPIRIALITFLTVIGVIVAFVAGLSVLMGGCEQHVYAKTTVLNYSRNASFQIVSYAISWNDVGYRVIIDNAEWLEFQNTGIFGKWVNDDSILIVTNDRATFNRIPKHSRIKIGMDTLMNNSPYLYDKKLLRLENLRKDTTIFSN